MNTRHTLVSIAVVMFAAGCGGGGANGGFSPLLLPAAPPAPPPAAPPPPAMSLAEKCPTLKGQTLAGGTVAIDDAKLVAASAPQPEYCVVSASFKGSTLRFEARLPTADGTASSPSSAAAASTARCPRPPPRSSANRSSPSATRPSAPTAATTIPGATDLNYFKGEFALDDAKLLDFTQQSEHRALPPGKEVIAQFFGTAPTRSYFEGCSMGGHDAMMQAQRFPEDFDGIVARAPAGNIMGLFVQFNRIAKQVRVPANTLNPAKQTLLANAVLAQCDGLDGVADGIISKPAACTFDATALRCAGGADTGDSCLSDAQIATVNTITSPIATSDGAWSHTGYNFGAENSPKGWGEYIWPQAAFGGASVQGLFSDGFVRSFITRDAAFDTSAPGTPTSGSRGWASSAGCSARPTRIWGGCMRAARS
jgi:hypothetical protein